jgi:hypothetical protein
MASGQWEFDELGSNLTIYGILYPVDEAGRIEPNWHVPKPGRSILSIEKLWFRVVVASGSQYPKAIGRSDELLHHMDRCVIAC